MAANNNGAPPLLRVCNQTAAAVCMYGLDIGSAGRRSNRPVGATGACVVTAATACIHQIRRHIATRSRRQRKGFTQ